ncbi:MAG: M20 family metallo-hydrolase [Candidatus Cyclobacteriaceae bacterium M3_2C_046]
MEPVEVLKKLISLPSYSQQEDKTADLLEDFLKKLHLQVHRKYNNVWVKSSDYNSDKPVILLNSHHDTVKATEKWGRDPFNPEVEDGKLFGLGSNDAGASLVTLLFTFLSWEKRKSKPFNLIFAASAEEEITGAKGIESILGEMGHIDLGIVGEPTQMQMAIAEKGLMVLDCETQGKSGHAARQEGVNAIYQALKDIEWFRTFHFPKKSLMLGPVKTTVTQMEAGYQHNVIPDVCKFVVDVRTNEHYTNQEIFDTICHHVSCQVKPRSLRLNSSGISLNHPLVQRGLELGLEYFGSPTLSDQALMPFPSLKIGPGDSARSHTANEFVFIHEIEQGLNIYQKLLDGVENVALYKR